MTLNGFAFGDASSYVQKARRKAELYYTSVTNHITKKHHNVKYGLPNLVFRYAVLPCLHLPCMFRWRMQVSFLSGVNSRLVQKNLFLYTANNYSSFIAYLIKSKDVSGINIHMYLLCREYWIGQCKLPGHPTKKKVVAGHVIAMLTWLDCWRRQMDGSL